MINIFCSASDMLIDITNTNTNKYHQWLVPHIESEYMSSSLGRDLCFSVFPSVWLTTMKVWKRVDAVTEVALLWCNFSSCSWQLLVESKLEASWFRYHSGEDQQGTVKLGPSYSNMRLSHLTKVRLFHLTLSRLYPLLKLLHLKTFFLEGMNFRSWRRNRLLASWSV